MVDHVVTRTDCRSACGHATAPPQGVRWQVAPPTTSTGCQAALTLPAAPHAQSRCTHLAVGDVAGDVPNGKDAQQAVVIPPRVVHHPAGGLKPAPRLQPVPYTGGLLLWAVEAVFAIEDSGLVGLAEPGDQERDLQGKRQAGDLLSQVW